MPTINWRLGAALERAAQAHADRLTGRAEADLAANLSRSREAEAARWQAMADHYQRCRSAQAATDRLTRLAEQVGSLTRAQQAEADRLTGLAAHLASR